MSSVSSCVLSTKEVSCSNLVLIYTQALSTGIAGNRETTLKEIIVSSSSVVMSVISVLNCVELATKKPLRFCDKNLDVSYKAEFMQVTIGLRMIFLMMFHGSSDSRWYGVT